MVATRGYKEAVSVRYKEATRGYKEAVSGGYKEATRGYKEAVSGRYKEATREYRGGKWRVRRGYKKLAREFYKYGR